MAAILLAAVVFAGVVAAAQSRPARATAEPQQIASIIRQVQQTAPAQLTRNTRLVLLSALHRARANFVNGKICIALYELDGLHGVLKSPPSSERVGQQFAALADARLNAVETRLVRRVPPACAIQATASAAGPFVDAVHDTGQVAPLSLTPESGQDAERQPQPETPPTPGVQAPKVVTLTPDTPAPTPGPTSFGVHMAQLVSPFGPAVRTSPTDPMQVLANVEFRGGDAEPFDASEASRTPVAVLAGNTFLAVKTATGGSFTSFPITDLFTGPAKTPDAGFCCDQDIIYDPTTDLFIDVVQTWCTTAPDGTLCPSGKAGLPDAQLNNRYVLLAADPDTLISKGVYAWRSTDLTGSGIVGPGTSFDQPSLALGANFLYLSANSFRANHPGQTGANGSTILRISLKELRAAYDDGGKFGIKSWWISSAGNTRFLQNAGTTAYVFGFGGDKVKGDEITAWPLPESSGLLGPVNEIPISKRGTDYSSTAPNGKNWNSPALNPLASSVLVGKRIWLAFGQGRPAGTSSPAAEPDIRIIQLDASSLGWVSDTEYQVPGFASGFPYLATNIDGEVAMAFVFGGTSQFPTSAVALLTGTQHMAVLGISDWANAGDRRGDYYRVRRDGGDGHLFSAGMYREIVPSGGPDEQNMAQWALFGRNSGPSVVKPDITVDTVAKCGFSVKNIGALSTGPFVARVTMTYGVNNLGWDFKVDNLKPYETKWFEYGLSDGIVTIKVNADQANKVAESNEANNTGSYKGPPCIT